MKKQIHLGLIFLGVLVAFSLFGIALLAPYSWPAPGNWNLLTHNGMVIADEEERGSCSDPTRNASISQSNDIGSQADCQGPAPHYNPGNNGQPGATDQNTYSAALYYEDQNGDSNGCSNLADDYLYFRIRLVGDPLQNNVSNGLTNDYWWYLFDIDADYAPDFYIRLNGNGKKPAETLDVLYETSGDAYPTGEPVVASYINPLDNGYVQAGLTPDNGTVGDYDESFLDFQIPLTDFDDDGGVQQLCEGSSLQVSKVSTSANHNDPYQKDHLLDLLLPSDPIILGDNNYEIIKTVNGIVGNTVEYRVQINNLSNTLSGLVFTDPLAGLGTFETNAYGSGRGIQVNIGGNTFNMTNSVDSPDSGGCTYLGCEADYTAGNVNFYLDWLYPAGSATPLYDTVTIKYKVTYPGGLTYSNQGYGVTNELPNNQYSDDPTYDDGSECSDASGNNCDDGDTGNDDPTLATIFADDYGDAPDPTYPTLAASTGASHKIVPGFFLGTLIDSDPDGQPNVGATGDDAFDGNDDEDGVTFVTSLIPGNTATVDIVASTAGFVDAWVDMNADGSWATAGDQVMASQPVVPGLNSLVVSIPATANPGATYARFRFSSLGALPFNGPAPDGEVEDYLVDITASSSIGDFIWHDVNGDGVQDPPEPGLDNVTVDLYLDDGDSVFEPGADDGVPLLSQTTAVGGAYDFLTLSPGSYWIDITDNNGVLTNFVQTGGNPAPELISLAAAQDYNNADYGFFDTHSDDDHDGIRDVVECPGAPPFIGCPDTDSDGYPDYLDIDADNDGIVDNIEGQSESAYIPPTGLDTDGDDLDDAYDPDNGGFLIVPVDRDADLTPDYLDLDTDGDTVPDPIEGHDLNFDGVADTTPTGTDSDMDGLDDAYDTLPKGDPLNCIGSNAPLQDFDSDNVRDWRDYDDDDDLIDTIDEDLNGNNDPTDDDVDGDTHPEYLDYNPMGYFYQLADGKIIAGGGVSVTGPGVVTLLEDGSAGYYRWVTDDTPGTYTMTVTTPTGYFLHPACNELDPPPLDPTASPNPVNLGNSEVGNTGFLSSNACTSYYYTFDLEPGDPIIINNNIPVFFDKDRPHGDDDDDDDDDDDGPGGGDTDPVPTPVPELDEAAPEACLQYNDRRPINYKDNEDWPKDYVDFLSKIYRVGSPKQYIISGDGSYHGDESTENTVIRPLDFTNRFETVKMALTSFCIPIYTTQERINAGNIAGARPEFPDFPRELPADHLDKEWVKDKDLEFIANVMYKAYDEGIIDGRIREDGIGYAEWNEDITRAEILKVFVNAADLESVVEELQTEDVVEDPLSYYYDARPDAWYTPYIPFVVNFKIVADVCLPRDLVESPDFENNELNIRTLAATYTCEGLNDPARFTFADNPAVRAEVFALDARMLYIASAIDHVNKYSGFNMINSELLELIFDELQDAERSEFLFGIKDTEAFVAELGYRNYN